MSTRQINYNLPPEMGMVGLRDVFVVAPASSFHHNQQQQHEPIFSDHQHNINNSNSATALGVGVGVGVGVFPLLTSAPCLEESDNRNRNSGIHLWQQNQQSHHGNYFKNSSNLNNTSGGGIAGGNSSTTTCQDCGNQAKKDCTHHRCRTCCKSRGFDCATHVKSTWVPAARRRERQISVTAVAAAAGSSGSTSGVKKPRLAQTTTTSHTSTSNTTPPRSFDTSSSHQDASFREGLPGQVRAPAVFKCVRVTALEDGEDEYAYQAVVKIGGHVFKGFLYDHGVDEREGFPNISELHLGGSNGGRNGASSSSPILDASDVYATASGGGLLGGTGYGNQIN